MNRDRTGEGAVGSTPRGSVTTPWVKVTAADTLGAGNIFQAALLTWAAETSRLMPGVLAAIDDAALAEAQPLPPAPRP